MELNELMKAFGDKVGIAGLEPTDEGVYLLSFDDMSVGFKEDIATKSLIIASSFAAKPGEGSDRLAEILLGANHLFVATDGNTIAFDPNEKNYVLQRREPLAMLDIESFMGIAESFVNSLEQYKKLVEEFRPALEEVEKCIAKEAEEITSFHSNGFMQV